MAAIKNHRQRIEELEEDRDALLESMAGMVPEALDSLTREEKHGIYRMLRLEVMLLEEGYQVSGAFCVSDCTCCRKGKLKRKKQAPDGAPVRGF